ncbi:variant surface glycoprotein [Trypanosoma brucei equiperdum]|uniref:Variant surface glycoprotein n=1 Tax=Trypanosoma brucei equiperdum TaxID=630700 RepID=A0A3L6LF63_9TRYP|nr:variant surface glycoprotein [Trypanosoma brucei equiperdum]
MWKFKVLVVFAVVIIAAEINSGKIVNQEEFEILCGFVRLTLAPAPLIQLSQRIKNEAVSVAVDAIYREPNQEHLWKKLLPNCEAHQISDRESVCDAFARFKHEAEERLKASRLTEPELTDYSPDVLDHLEKAFKLYQASELEGKQTSIVTLQDGINSIMYGENDSGGNSLRRYRFRYDDCGSVLGQRPKYAGGALVTDLLCLCAQHVNGSDTKHLCCEGCNWRSNTAVWSEEGGLKLQWEILREKCGKYNVDLKNPKDTLKRLREEMDCRTVPTGIDSPKGLFVYTYGELEKRELVSCGGEDRQDSGACVLYEWGGIQVHTAKIPWMQRLEKLVDMLPNVSEESNKMEKRRRQIENIVYRVNETSKKQPKLEKKESLSQQDTPQPPLGDVLQTFTDNPNSEGETREKQQVQNDSSDKSVEIKPAEGRNPGIGIRPLKSASKIGTPLTMFLLLL